MVNFAFSFKNFGYLMPLILLLLNRHSHHFKQLKKERKKKKGLNERFVDSLSLI